MTDLALDTTARDLRFGRTAEGRATLAFVRGPEEVAQAVGIHLRTWIGEWFLDRLHGVPYLEAVLGHNRRRHIVEAVLRAHILSVAGVTGIKSFDLYLDRAARTLRVDFEITTPQGDARGSLLR